MKVLSSYFLFRIFIVYDSKTKICETFTWTCLFTANNQSWLWLSKFQRIIYLFIFFYANHIKATWRRHRGVTNQRRDNRTVMANYCHLLSSWTWDSPAYARRPEQLLLLGFRKRESTHQLWEVVFRHTSQLASSRLFNSLCLSKRWFPFVMTFMLRFLSDISFFVSSPAVSPFFSLYNIQWKYWNLILLSYNYNNYNSEYMIKCSYIDYIFMID